MYLLLVIKKKISLTVETRLESDYFPRWTTGLVLRTTAGWWKHVIYSFITFKTFLCEFIFFIPFPVTEIWLFSEVKKTSGIEGDGWVMNVCGASVSVGAGEVAAPDKRKPNTLTFSGVIQLGTARRETLKAHDNLLLRLLASFSYATSLLNSAMLFLGIICQGSRLCLCFVFFVSHS